MYIYRSISLCMNECLSLLQCMSLYLSIDLTMNVPVSLSLSLCLSIYLPKYDVSLSIYITMSLYLYICLTMYVCIYCYISLLCSSCYVSLSITLCFYWSFYFVLSQLVSVSLSILTHVSTFYTSQTHSLSLFQDLIYFCHLKTVSPRSRYTWSGLPKYTNKHYSKIYSST